MVSYYQLLQTAKVKARISNNFNSKAMFFYRLSFASFKSAIIFYFLPQEI